MNKKAIATKRFININLFNSFEFWQNKPKGSD